MLAKPPSPARARICPVCKTERGQRPAAGCAGGAGDLCVHEHIRDICRRLALEGYLAVAPELYFREGDSNDHNDIPTLFSELVSKVPDS